MDLRGHDAFLSVDESGIFDEAEHDFSFSHTPPDGVPHNSQGMPYGYTDVSGLSGPVNPARDRSGYQDFTKPTEPRPTNRGAVEPRTKAQPARDTLRATQAGSQQLLKDGLRNVRRLQDLEHRLTQRVSGLEGRLSGLENSIRQLGATMKVIKELSESHHGMIHEAIQIAQALNPAAEFSDTQVDGISN